MNICRCHLPPHRRCPRLGPIQCLIGLVTFGACWMGCGREPAVRDLPEQVPAAPSATLPSVTFPPVPEEIEDLYTHSVAVAERAVAESKQAAQPLFDLAATHQRFGFDREAVAAYRRGLKIDANRSDIYMEIGFLLSQKAESVEDAAADFQEALEAYRAALRLNPHAVGARTRIGMIYAHQGQLDEAITEYQQEIEQQTSSTDTFYHLGQALLLKEDFAAAEEAFRACLQREPQHRNALYGLFQALRNQGREDESRQFLDSWKSLRAAEKERIDFPPPRGNQDQRSVAETYFRIALTHLGADRVDEALQHFEAALRFDATHELAATNWVNVLRQMGRIDEAMKLGLRLLEPQPDNVTLLYLVAGLAAEQGDVQLASELLERVLKIQPQHANANRELARLILRRQLRGPNSADESLQYARLAVQQERSAPNLDVLAYALFMSGRRTEAVDALEEAVRLAPDNQELRQRLEKARQR